MCVLYFKGRSRSGDRSYRGRSRSGDRSYRIRGKVAIGGRGRRFGEVVPLGEEVAIGRRSRSGDRSYRGGVRRERSASGEVAIGRREGRDREIAPTAFSDNYELKKQSGGVSPTALSVSSHRFIPETSLLLAGRFQFAPSRCCFTSGTNVPFETVRTCQGLAISV